MAVVFDKHITGRLVVKKEGDKVIGYIHRTLGNPEVLFQISIQRQEKKVEKKKKKKG